MQLISPTASSRCVVQPPGSPTMRSKEARQTLALGSSRTQCCQFPCHGLSGHIFLQRRRSSGTNRPDIGATTTNTKLRNSTIAGFRWAIRIATTRTSSSSTSARGRMEGGVHNGSSSAFGSDSSRSNVNTSSCAVSRDAPQFQHRRQELGQDSPQTLHDHSCPSWNRGTMAPSKVFLWNGNSVPSLFGVSLCRHRIG